MAGNVEKRLALVLVSLGRLRGPAAGSCRYSPDDREVLLEPVLSGAPLPPDFWPVELEVDDFCITNAGWVWKERHLHQ